MEKYICAWILSFFIYGFAGWIWESFLCPILTKHHIKNSGFLNGPIVPIYAVGALSVSLLFSMKESYLSIFIEGAVVACLIEYLTSWIMEKLYHRRWWDYSDKAFQLNGRICLEGFLVFGLFSVVAVKFVQPYLMNKLMQYDTILLIIVSTVLCTLLIIDLIVTIISLTHLDEHIEDIKQELIKMLDEIEDNSRNWSDVLEKNKDIIKNKGYSIHRIIKAFPHILNQKKRR